MAVFSLTKKADYGLSMLSLLASRGEGGKISLTELAKKGLPRAFMAQIASRLVQTGFLDSKEGRGGGYSLIKEPEKMSLINVLEAIDGEMALVSCVTKVNNCPIEDHCWQRSFMRRFNHQIQEMVGQYTVADLVTKSK